MQKLRTEHEAITDILDYLRSFKLEKGDSWLVSDPEVVGPSPTNK